ncbi:hypothetical protein WMY93_006281 [Mugilogobius chulae]|uniref:TEN1 subunit of CST complex n=1 Tax=Mugilogobius chulae TaxID=88201 RepID=A0AAW0PM18_9GOBI
MPALRSITLSCSVSFSLGNNLGAALEGDSLRTFGKLVRYVPAESMATLSAHHSSKEHSVIVNTVFVEPFDAIIGARYMVLGELENVEGAGAVVRARVLNCVDGANIALLQKAITDQRRFLEERETTGCKCSTDGAASVNTSLP